MKKLLFLAFLTVLSTAVFAQVEGQSKKQSKKKSKEIVVEEDTLPKVPVIKFNNLVHDYGNIYKGDNGVCTFEFKNVGKADLILTNVNSSCGCTVPKWPREPISPGETSSIQVSYNTNSVGAINKHVTVSTNTAEERITLSIKGSVSDKPKEIVPEEKTSPLMIND